GGNGNSIVLAPVGGHPALFVGGHFGTRDPNSMPCGSTYLHGVLKADPATGAIDCSWNPHLVPDVHNYTGGWVERVANGHLWLGGSAEARRALEGRSVPHRQGPQRPRPGDAERAHRSGRGRPG